jgi:hypothetical protein
MLNLPEVENAKTVMTIAVSWSVVRWLAEKKKVRKAADVANAALDALNREVKTTWSDELKAAYNEMTPPDAPGICGRIEHKTNGKTVSIDPGTKLLAKSIKQADEEAYRARMDAEDTFDRAEKILSTAMAREGTRKAINSWVLHEEAIIKAKAAAPAAKTGSGIK